MNIEKRIKKDNEKLTKMFKNRGIQFDKIKTLVLLGNKVIVTCEYKL